MSELQRLRERRARKVLDYFLRNLKEEVRGHQETHDHAPAKRVPVERLVESSPDCVDVESLQGILRVSKRATLAWIHRQSSVRRILGNDAHKVVSKHPRRRSHYLSDASR